MEACGSSEGRGESTLFDEVRRDAAPDSSLGRFALGGLGGALGSSSLGCTRRHSRSRNLD